MVSYFKTSLRVEMVYNYSKQTLGWVYGEQLPQRAPLGRYMVYNYLKIPLRGEMRFTTASKNTLTLQLYQTPDIKCMCTDYTKFSAPSLHLN